MLVSGFADDPRCAQSGHKVARPVSMQLLARKRRSGWQPQIALGEGNNFYDRLRCHKLAANSLRRARGNEQLSTDH
jgi:hypothetical protein